MEDEGDEEEEEEEDEGVNFRMTIPLGWWKCWREGCEEKKSGARTKKESSGQNSDDGEDKSRS